MRRVVAFSPQRKTILEALDTVIASSSFESSQRAQEFLRYVVEHALDGELDRLKERVIGYALFGRKPDYDTGADSIVRVTAAEVRKRLEMYYEQTAGTEPVTRSWGSTPIRSWVWEPARIAAPPAGLSRSLSLRQ